MKKNITVEMTTKTLTVSKAFYKKATACGSAEYYELRQAMIENPDFTIEFKVIEKKTYKQLTFAVMEEYIKTQPHSEKQLVKFAAVQRIAKTKNSLYPLTKKWFLSTYPEYKNNEVNDIETAAILEDAEAEAAAELENLIDLSTAANQ